MKRVDVLDEGYVILKDHMGSDLSVVNAARASYAKESTELTAKDRGLIKFLAKNGHTSPFRHAMMTFEIKAPLMIARQWWKYTVGSDHTMEGWNEASRRYVTSEPEFYIPEKWRHKPENSKQGSGDFFRNDDGLYLTDKLLYIYDECDKIYRELLEKGVAPEMARLALPANGQYTNWWWTCSLQCLAHVLDERLEDEAQWEWQPYAGALWQLSNPIFPVSIEALIGEKHAEGNPRN